MGQVGFIGRKQELALIERLVYDKSACFLLITGEGGIGKTRLLNEISDRYGDPNQINITNIFDFDDSALHLTENVFTRIAEELDRRKFEPYLKKLIDYKKIQTIDISREQLIELKEALEASFIQSFNQLTNIKRIVLRFDTTDSLKGHTEVLENFLRFGKKLQNALIVIAGRDAEKFEIFLKDESEKTTIKKIKLLRLPENESQEYLRQKQSNLPIPFLESELKQKLLFLSGGKPILLDLAVEWIARGIELDWISKVSSEVVTTLSEEEISQLRKTFEIELVQPIAKTTAKIHWVFLLMAWVYPIDGTMLAAFRNTSTEDAEEILNKAQTYVFVKQLPNNSFKLHDEMRRMIEDYVWPEIDRGKELRKEYSSKALKYFEKAINQIEREIVSLKREDNREPAWQPELEEKRQQLWVMQEQRLKHGLIFDLNDGLNLFEQIYEAASTDASITFRPQFIRLVKDNKERLSIEQNALLDYYNADQLFSQEADYEAARTIIEALLKIDTLPLDLRIKCLKLRGNIRIRQGEVDKAIEDFRQAVVMSKDTDQIDLLIQSINALGWAYKQRGDLEQALEYYKEARWLYHSADIQIQSRLKNDYGLILNNIAVLLSNSDATRKAAINTANSAIVHWKKIANELGRGKGYLAQGICYHQTDHSEQTFEAFKKALNIFEPLGLNEWTAQILSWRGTQYHNIGRNQEAKKDLTRSLEIGPQNIKTMTLNRLGRVHMDYQDWNKAQEYLEESLKLAEKMPDYKYWLMSISRLIIIAAKTGKIKLLNKLTEKLDKWLKKNKDQHKFTDRMSTINQPNDLKEKLDEWLKTVKNPDKNAQGITYLGIANIAFLQNSHENIPLIIDMLKKGIPNVVLCGSWARRDIVKRLGFIEEDFHKIDQNIIKEVGRRMIDFIYEKEKEDINYSTALEIMFKWADWQGETKKPDAILPDPEEETHNKRKNEPAKVD
jgi:tetratricopeptide (TPR) repeat protein